MQCNAKDKLHEKRARLLDARNSTGASVARAALHCIDAHLYWVLLQVVAEMQSFVGCKPPRLPIWVPSVHFWEIEGTLT